MLDIVSKIISIEKKLFFRCSKAAICKPYVKLSSIFSDNCMQRIFIERESFEQNQWNFTAKCFDLGVTLIGTSFANFSASALSSHTCVYIVDIIGLGRPMLEHSSCNRSQNGSR